MILKFLENAIEKDKYLFYQTMSSLSDIFIDILGNTDSTNLQKFLDLCYGDILPYHIQNLEIHTGTAKEDIFDASYPVIKYDNDFLRYFDKDGTNKIDFLTTYIKVDPDITSHFAKGFVEVLHNEERKFFLESDIVTLILQKYWDSSKIFLYFNLFVYSVLMILLTITVSSYDSSYLKSLEATTGILAAINLVYEIIQFMILGFNNYTEQAWNIVELINFIVILVVSYIRYGQGQGDDDLWSSWLYSVCIIAGYFRWISYLKMFDSTRYLIRAILKIFEDMKSFISIIVFILFGFCGTLMAFKYEEYNFIQTLEVSYYLLFGPLEVDSPVSLKIIALIYPFVLNVVLLNMLISIMGNTFDEVNGEILYTDNTEKAALIFEAVKFINVFRRLKPNKLLYLISAKNENEYAKKREKSVTIFKLNENLTEKVEFLEESFSKRISMLEVILKQNQETLKIQQDMMKENQEMLKKLVEGRK